MTTRSVKAEEMENAAHAAGDKIRQTAGQIKNGLENMAGTVAQTAGETGTVVREAAEKTIDKAGQASKSTMRFVKDNPVESSLIALLTGVVLGTLIRR